MQLHERFMLRAIELAKQGLGHTRSNPVVGCVIVNENKIISEGYHYQFGGLHAEIVALNSLKDRSLLKTSTMYVTLEPCSHFGKTPPCAQTIISEGIPKVFIASPDPNPLVSGNGIKQLQEHGIFVKTGILEKEYRFVNRRFFTFFDKKRPYIILKWAQSKDGFLSPESHPEKPTIHWISSEVNKVLVHKWRSEEMAILVGSNTVKNDNPQLTVRLWKGKQPLRIVIQNTDDVSVNSSIFNSETTTLRFTQNSELKEIPGVETICLKNEGFLQSLLNELYRRNIVSLIVEGGRYTLQQFIDQNLWDEARIITGNIEFKSGVKAPVLPYSKVNVYQIGNDEITEVFNG